MHQDHNSSLILILLYLRRSSTPKRRRVSPADLSIASIYIFLGALAWRPSHLHDLARTWISLDRLHAISTIAICTPHRRVYHLHPGKCQFDV
ncbi:hypothetical protein B0H13DRAFT_2371490 [Mycena leptocephala]|nr:hypothetical protein B0H13DRAFT_2371490 [Mycena leptocephala]